ncbi:hypothetical protein [Crassaminicella thermophila]|uniref:hypothetical protein n=1 Tax=Crassaminicella thermophila TaxID=2599308 RepID=UPI00143D3DAE|nr:hypothetical protein [Crassaminicella thermophila]
MWTVVYMAHNQTDADKIKLRLVQEGFLVKLKRQDSVYEILVPNGEVEEAHEILLNL